MKKIFLLLSLTLPCNLFAGNITPEQAQAVAERFFPSTRGGSTVTLKWDGRSTAATRTAQADAPFYVFDHSAGGFVIIAGDDRTEPVLGYSDEGTFKVEGMPDHVRYWFDYLREGIEYLRDNDIAPSAAVKAKWKACAAGTVTRAAAGRLLETAKWDQYAPYNTLVSQWCGFAEGSVYTGCVATATSIIMRYHKYPAHGSGTLSGYSYADAKHRSRSVKGYDLGDAYDWDNMLLSYSGSYTAEQGNAVGQLMKDVGIMVKMSFGTMDTGGSGSDNSNVPPALVKYMGYDKSVERFDRGSVTDDEWITYITDCIDNCGPVLCNGWGSPGGHAFVLDGYNADRQIHINWGWSGANNGYFTVPNFGAFPTYQSIYVNIKPDEGGAAPEAYIIMNAPMRMVSAPALKSADKLKFTLSSGQAVNGSTGLFNGTVYLAHTGADNTIKSYLRTYTGTDMEMGFGFGEEDGVYEIDMNKFAAGDKVKWLYKLNGSNELRPVKVNREYDHVSELVIDFDPGVYYIESKTSVAYDSVQKRITVKTASGVDCRLVQANGSEVNTGITSAGTTFTIDTKSLAGGTYTLRLSSGDYVKEVKFIL